MRRYFGDGRGDFGPDKRQSWVFASVLIQRPIELPAAGLLSTALLSCPSAGKAYDDSGQRDRQ